MATRRTLVALSLAALALAPAARAQEGEGGARVYQLRTYATAPEKLEVLLDRFGSTNLPLFEEHGITLVGAWTPADTQQEEPRLVYLVSFRSKEAAEEAWEAFSGDPEWQEAFGKEKEEHGEVVTRVETVYLEPMDYSPDPSSPEIRGPGGEEPRLFELRRYTASPGKLGDLHARFREHTLELFAKHMMTIVVYTTPVEGEPGAGEQLVYLLAHASQADALNSWESFRTDPDWQEVYRQSQPDGVRLAAEVESTYLTPTEFSPLR